MSKVVLVTNVSSVFGRRTSIALAKAGHTVFAGIHERRGMSALAVDSLMALADEAAVDLRAVKFDILSQESIAASVRQIVAEAGRIDAVVQDFGYRVHGPARSFTAGQLAQLYGINLLSMRAVNEAVLPHLRRQRRGLIVWISSISATGTPPSDLTSAFAKANLESATEARIDELKSAGIDLCTVLPVGIEGQDPSISSAGYLADAVTSLVDAPDGERPYRMRVDAIGARITADFLPRSGPGAAVRPQARARQTQPAPRTSATVISLEAYRRGAATTWRLSPTRRKPV